MNTKTKENVSFFAHQCNFTEDGMYYLVRCPACDRENWALAVATGQCAWCGWEPEEESEPTGGTHGSR